MQYQKPGFIMKIASAEYDKAKAGSSYLFRVRQDSNKWLLSHKSSYPSTEQYADAIKLIEAAAGVCFSQQEVKEILELFPVARIELAVYGIDKIEVQNNILDAVSNFVLGCTWPRLNDNVDTKKFVRLLRRQALLMGYMSLENIERVPEHLGSSVLA